MDWVIDESSPQDEVESILENGIGELYRGFYRLRQSGQYQREYDMMGQLINMLQEDRAHLRSKYEVV